MTKTDWDAYYAKVAPYTRVTRAISRCKLMGVLGPCLRESAPASICEFGGGNSFIAGELLRDGRVSRYHVIDANEAGLQLLNASHGASPKLSMQLLDLTTASGSGAYDIVFSVGLIEHFSPDETARMVQRHFEMCRPGGHVLMTFPTPTSLYRSIRGAAEALGSWAFPDERPLRVAEVGEVAGMFGTCRHSSINWLIGLTQAVMLYQKR